MENEGPVKNPDRGQNVADAAAATSARPVGIMAHGNAMRSITTMRRLYWLASYPRSGNTWLRYLIANAFLGDFEQPADVARAIPDANNQRIPSKELPRPVAFIKKHRCFEPASFTNREVAGVIYLIRNPVDVLQSVLRYAVMTGLLQPEAHPTLTYEETVRAWIRAYLKHEGWPRGVPAGFGSWRDNVASWTIDELPFPRLVLRYEDVCADTPAALRQIASFIGAALSDARIARAIDVSSAERLMALEDAQRPGDGPALFASAAVERKRALGLRFIRSGDAPGAAALSLTPAEVDAARRTFADLMERFGYA